MSSVLSVKWRPIFLINSPKPIQHVESFLLKGKFTLDKARPSWIDKFSNPVKGEFANIREIKRGRENWSWLFKILLLLSNDNILKWYFWYWGFFKNSPLLRHNLYAMKYIHFNCTTQWALINVYKCIYLHNHYASEDKAHFYDPQNFSHALSNWRHLQPRLEATTGLLLVAKNLLYYFNNYPLLRLFPCCSKGISLIVCYMDCTIILKAQFGKSWHSLFTCETHKVLERSAH